MLHNPSTNTMRLHILESATGAPIEAPQLELAPEESPSGWVFLHQQPLVIPDVRLETRWPSVMELLRRNNIVTSCWLPLTTAQHRLGALVFGFGPAPWAQDQLAFMQQVAAQVAVAVDNTLNFQKAEKYQQQMVRERDRLQVLLEITNTLVSGTGYPRSVSQHHRLRAPLCPSRICQPRPARARNQSAPHSRACFDGPGTVLEEGATAAMSETPRGEAVETRRPVILHTEALARVSSPIVQRLAAAGLKSICCLPLITRLHVLGTLNVGSTRENAFSEADVDF